jgi:murein DD-endopeptidase MepM/ murein hydrolase activator NlpD
MTLLFAAIFLISGITAWGSPVITLESLDQNDPVLLQIRSDVKKSLSAVRGSGELPQLQFYSYTVSPKDTFWVILSRTGLNIDTLITVNSILNPSTIQSGDILYLPNMRGIIYEIHQGDTIESIEKNFSVSRQLIFSANKITSLSKKFIFIPGGQVTSLERSLFLGTGFAAPLQNFRKTSGFGMRRDPLSGEQSFHTGVDLGCSVGTKVFAARAGKVIFTGYRGGYGNLVIIEHPCGYYSYYGHLSSIMVKVGQAVNPNNIIALSGNTGRTTGPHLHFEIRKNAKPVNPVILLR